MPGPAPTDPARRRRRNRPALAETVLSAGGATVPKLPAWRPWTPATRAWWKKLWTLPEASQWDPSGVTLAPAALVFDSLVTGAGPVAALSAELPYHYDRHGLSPRARLQLRWRAEEGTAGEVTGPDVLVDHRRRRRLARQMGRPEPPPSA